MHFYVRLAYCGPWLDFPFNTVAVGPDFYLYYTPGCPCEIETL